MLGGKKIDVNTLTSLSRSIWLAGLGAYAKTNEKLIDSADKAYESANATFQELLAKGETIHEEATAKSRTELDTRVGQLKERLGLTESNTDTEEKLNALSARVQTLAEAVALLVEQKTEAHKVSDEPKVDASPMAETATEEVKEAAPQMPLIEETEEVTAEAAKADVIAEEKPAARRTTARRSRRTSKATSPKA